MLFVQGEVVLEVVAQGLFVLLVTLAGEAFDQAAVGEGFAGETGEFGDGFAPARDSNQMAAAGKEAHGEIKTAQRTNAAGFDGEKFRMKATVVNEDR